MAKAAKAYNKGTATPNPGRSITLHLYRTYAKPEIRRMLVAAPSKIIEGFDDASDIWEKVAVFDVHVPGSSVRKNLLVEHFNKTTMPTGFRARRLGVWWTFDELTAHERMIALC